MAIFESGNSPLTNTEAVTGVDSNLTGQIRAITYYSNETDMKNEQFDYEKLVNCCSSSFPTVLVVILDEPSDEFISKLTYDPPPSMLQVSLSSSKSLLKRAYDLRVYSLQMIHLSRCLRHLIITLANSISTVYATESPDIEAALTTEDDLADLLCATPSIIDELDVMIESLRWILDEVESGSFDHAMPETEIKGVFSALCGDFPGAVPVRHSDKHFRELAALDYEEKLFKSEAADSNQMLLSPRNLQIQEDNSKLKEIAAATWIPTVGNELRRITHRTSDSRRSTHFPNQGWTMGGQHRESDGQGSHRGELGKNTTPDYPADRFSPIYGQPHPFRSISSERSDYAGPSVIQDSMDTEQTNFPRGSSSALPRASSFPRARRTHSPRNELASDYSGSSANTPALTEGSADPAQSDGEEAEFWASASIEPISSSSPTFANSRWASFQMPADIFGNDPARHVLYHSIRHENWFVNQDYERSITGAESAQIPGTIPGDSVLLAFYTKVLGGRGKTVMLCTICAHKNQKSTPYTRPDRAKVHIRHHFELRPVACTGKCKNTQCTQRFFTKNDLDAHVTGRTDPFVPCIYCNRPLLAKNRHRHITSYCPAAPEEIRSKRP